MKTLFTSIYLNFVFIIITFCQTPNWIQQTTNLPQGCVTIDIDPVDENIAWGFGIKPGTFNKYHGFIRTTDGGINWTCDTIDIMPTNYGIASISAVDAFTAFVVGYDNSGVNTGGIFKTKDGGVTWGKDMSAFNVTGGWPNFIHFFNASDGVCVGDPNNGYFEIYTTNNGGESWIRVPSSNIPTPLTDEYGFVSSYCAFNDCLWFGTGGKGRLFRTTDKGKTWSVSQLPSFNTNMTTAAAFENENVGLACTDFKKIFKTTDGGSNWTALTLPEWLSIGRIGSVPDKPGVYIGSGYFSWQPDTDWATAITVDGGKSWTGIDYTLKGPGIPRFYSDKVGWLADNKHSEVFKWVTLDYRCINLSSNKIDFNKILLGHSSDTLSIVISNISNKNLVVSKIQFPNKNFFWINPVSLPLTLNDLNSYEMKLTFSPTEAGDVKDSIIIESDAINSPHSIISVSGKAVVIEAPQPGKMYLGSSTLYSSDLTGSSITAIGNIEFTGLRNFGVNPLTNELYALHLSGTVNELVKLSCSTADFLHISYIPIFNLRAFAFNKTGEMFGGTLSGELFKINPETGDTLLIGKIPGLVYSGLAFNPNDDSLWASVRPTNGDKDAIYKINITNGQATLVGRTGDGNITPSIAFSANGNLYGLKGTGSQKNYLIKIDTTTGIGTTVYTSDISGLTAVAISPSLTPVEGNIAHLIPKDFELYQNYPNPFNPCTTIKFGLPVCSNVQLTIYDIMGRTVKSFSFNNHSSGYHNVVWDGKDNNNYQASSGIYLCQVKASLIEKNVSFIKSLKLVLIK